jgi:medium-chain acyl-[acyl-carrier-protein] hydrolase
MANEKNPWLIYRREVAGARLRLFGFPYGGGGASVYTTWPKDLPDGVELCPVQTPGRESRFAEPPVIRMPRMIDLLMDVLPSYLDRPFALFGHSVGALIAFELTRRLRRQGLRPPEWLFVSAHPSPGLPPRLPRVSRLSKPEFLRAMRGPYEMDPELLDQEDLMELVYPILRADYELDETALAGDEPPLDLPLSAFGGTGDPEATEAEIRDWSRHTTGPFRYRMLAGKHMFINTARDALLTELAADLKLALARL